MDSIKITKRTASTIAELADIALEHIPMTFSATDLSPGRKVFFPIPMKKNPRNMADFIYVFAECRIQQAPKDKNGYTDQDFLEDAGVYLFKKEGESMTGCTYPFHTFLQEVIKDLSLRNRMIYRISEMRNMVRLDDTFLELINSEYMSNKTKHISAALRLQ